MLRSALSLLFTTAFALPGFACDEQLPDTTLRNDIIIVVNDNAKDSCAVGTYYAGKRQLGKPNIVHVKTPVSPTITADQYAILRNQILAALQERLAQRGITPVGCPAAQTLYCPEKIEQLKAHSRVQYLAITKGLPARVIGVASEAGSIDGYLRHDLGDILYPARLDGLTLNASKSLIDRTLQVEATGFAGKLISAVSDTLPEGEGRTTFSQYQAVESDPLRLSERINFPGYGNGSIPPSITQGHNWRYALGLFNESDPVCTGSAYTGSFYLTGHSASSTSGKAPSSCAVQFVKSTGGGIAYNEPYPGSPSSRIPEVINAAAYFGYLDNQPTLAGNFSHLQNWKKTASCSGFICTDEACRNASTDPYKEIDTRCIGVGQGFIGHNFQSFPLSYYTSWPTGWRPTRSTSSGGSYNFSSNISGGTDQAITYPQVRTDDGADDNFSLWFASHDKKSVTECYDATLDSTHACPDDQRFYIGQAASNFDPILNLTTERHYRLSLRYKSMPGESSQALTSKLLAQLTAKDPNLGVTVKNTQRTGNNQIPLYEKGSVDSHFARLRHTDNLGSQTDAEIGIDSGGWVVVSAEFTLPVSRIVAAPDSGNRRVEGLAMHIQSNGLFSGSIGIDQVSLHEIHDDGSIKSELTLTNPSFSEGHQQFAIGDWATTFTSRLNGIAFWGSTTHNEGGTSFARRPSDSIANFLQGTPIAKSVWQDEFQSGGVLYGDPLYSPISVDILPPNPYGYLPAAQNIELFGNTVNGFANTQGTSYSLHYCVGGDFYNCDQSPSSWVALTENHTGGILSQSLLSGPLNLSEGDYLFRLSVESQVFGQVQTINDYLPVWVYNPEGDNDDDGLSNADEVEIHGSDARKKDSNNDGITDDIDVIHPCLKSGEPDSDGDGYSALVELKFPALDPCQNDAVDSDGDGQTDIVEIIAGTDPNDPDSFTDISPVIDYLLN